MLSPTIRLFECSCLFRSTFSRCSFLDSIAFFTRIRVLSRESGFSRKSKAPSLVARTAVSMVPWPEIMITSGGLSRSRIFSRVSSPSMPGSQMSSSTTSNTVLRSRSRLASPLSTDAAEYPSSASTPASDSRIPGSSSTMRTLCMLGTCRYGCVLGNHRQLDDEPGSHWLVLFYPDRTMVIFYHPAHNRQTQPSAAFLGRKIRQKKSLLKFPCHAMARIGYGDFDRVAARHQCGRDLNFPYQRILHSIGGIVHKIGYRAFDRLFIGHYFRKVRCERFVQGDAIQPSIKHGKGDLDHFINIRGLRF